MFSDRAHSAFAIVLILFAGCAHPDSPSGTTRPAADAQAAAHEKSVRPGINDKYFEDPSIPKWQTAFETESREIFALREEILATVGLEPGQVVADIGAGTGLYTFPFAEKVGAAGKVYAVDIVPEFLDHIRNEASRRGLAHIQTVLCRADSVELPANSIDVAFICDAYHHFEFPESTMSSLRRALRPNGRVVLIDFERIEGKSRPWVLDHVRAGKEVVLEEMARFGFRRIDEVNLLAENYIVRFER